LIFIIILESSSLGIGICIGIGIESFGMAQYQSFIHRDHWCLID